MPPGSSACSSAWSCSALLVIAAFGGSTVYDAFRSYRHAVAAIDREIGNVANALAEQTAWSLQSVDLVLLDTARWYRSDIHAIPPERRSVVMQNRTPRLPQVRQVVIVGAQGTILYASNISSTLNLDVADRSYFIAQRDGSASGLYMSEPLTTRAEGRAAIILSRRLDDDSGGFAGIVAANVDLDALAQLYRAVDLGNGGAIQLVRDDGTLLARSPAASGVAETEVSCARGCAGGIRRESSRRSSELSSPWRPSEIRHWSSR
jgi:hypothetical protein